MNTELVTISSEWKLINDGTQAGSIQVLSGVILVVESETKPAATCHSGHVVCGWLTITPPSKVWARVTYGSHATVAIS